MDWIGTLSVAFTALMVLGTFLAIRQTGKSEKARGKVESGLDTDELENVLLRIGAMSLEKAYGDKG